MKLGLALAGGGIKGAAHVGVLKAFQEKNIEIDMISGASSGSIVATLYAMGYRVDEIYTFFKKYAKEVKYADWSNIVKLTSGILLGKGITITGLTKGEALIEFFKERCQEKNIRTITDIKFPLYMSSVNLETGEVYIFTNSKCQYEEGMQLVNNITIPIAVRASCSYPGVFEPVNWNGHMLIDGGIRENIPWEVLQYCGATKVVSVVFEEENKKLCDKNMVNVIDCAIHYLNGEILKEELEGAKNVIKIKTPSVGLLDYTKVDELYELGYRVARKYLNEKF